VSRLIFLLASKTAVLMMNSFIFMSTSIHM
jgi:hypothetical protein